MISIIVPIFNVGKYLNRCIDSILAQTFVDFELLLINDGSTDSSKAICDEYISVDSRVKVFHKPNGGVSSARNLGIEKAKGEWITFIDPDDYIGQDFLQNYVEAINKDYDMAIQGFNEVFYNGTVDSNISDRELFDGRDLNLKLLQFMSNQLVGFVWNKMFKSSLIINNGIRFATDITLGEDTWFIVQYLENCRNFLVLPYADYYYIRHPKAACFKDHDYKSLIVYTSKIHNFYIRYANDDNQYLVNRLKNNFSMALDAVRLMYKQHGEKSKRIDFLKKLKLQEKQLRHCDFDFAASNRALIYMIVHLPVHLLDSILKSIVDVKK